jgi:FkbM family methyltransferase
MDIKADIRAVVSSALKNSFGKENYDEARFGKYVAPKRSLRSYVKGLLNYEADSANQQLESLVDRYAVRLQRVYAALSDRDRGLLLELLAYRILGYTRVKLRTNNPEYWSAIDTASRYQDLTDSYDPNFMHFLLHKFDLNGIGHDVKFYFNAGGVAIDFIIEQYAYKLNNVAVVSAEPSDTVLDLGGCWGDTALYFASKVGEGGKVFSFEFIPGNIKLFQKNTLMNPALSKRIELIPHPVTSASGEKVYYKDNGPGSKVESIPFDGQTGEVNTISIDDFVHQRKLDKVDFIKMDIEGAELMALKGALETIKRFKPKLAISIYHSLDDFVDIPNWILDLNLGYDININHYTIHAEETVCYAKVRNR